MLMLSDVSLVMITKCSVMRVFSRCVSLLLSVKSFFLLLELGNFKIFQSTHHGGIDYWSVHWIFIYSEQVKSIEILFKRAEYRYDIYSTYKITKQS